MQGRIRALWGLQSLYPKDAMVRRVEPDGTVSLSEGEVLIRYQTFTPGELAAIVDSGTVLPAGITRFRVKERVLGVRYPLDGMMEGDATTQNDRLEDSYADAGTKTGSAYYGEPVVLFE